RAPTPPRWPRTSCRCSSGCRCKRATGPPARSSTPWWTASWPDGRRRWPPAPPGRAPDSVAGVAEHFAVTGGARLVGAVDVVGAKNSVLKLMAAALLAEGTTTITNCPEILDVPLMADVLRSLGCTV